MPKTFQLRYLSILLTSLVFCLPVTANEPDKPTKGLDIELISETSTIVAGKPFTVGLHIRHHKGFHTYWQGPGIVGLATSLEWKLPPGFKASEIAWPYPEISSMAGHPCHGYERDVTLLVTITPPKNLPTQPITLSTTASWMCCATNCYPGSRTLTKTFKVGHQPTTHPAHAKLIQFARQQIPQPSPDCRATLLSGPKDTTVKVHFKLASKTAPTDLYLFSCDGQISSNLAQKFIRQPDGTIILTIGRSEFAPENPTHLPAVLKSGQQYFAINPKYSDVK